MRRYNHYIAGVDMSYQEDRFFAAVSVLATHGPIKQRLMKAYSDHLDPIEVDELPIAIQESFADLRQKLHCVAPMNGEGAICASVRKMSKEQADLCSNLILGMFRDVVHTDAEDCASLRDSEVSSVTPITMKVEAVEPVPPFLVKMR